MTSTTNLAVDGEEATSANAAPSTSKVARPLNVLVPLIKDEIKQGNEASVEHYRSAGAMLLEAKEQLAHGEWGPWLKRNFALSARTARDYMRLAAAAADNGSAAAVSTLSALTTPERPAAHPRSAAWLEGVRLAVKQVNVERLAQEQHDHETEKRLARELALELINIGYEALAAKMHPDKGGSPQGMARLDHARGMLRAGLEETRR